QFPFFENSIPEFCVIGGGQFVYIYDDSFVANNIMRHITDVVNSNIVSEITAYNGTVIKANRYPQVVKFQVIRLQLSNAYQPVKLTILYQCRIECIGNQYLVPVV